MRLIGLLCLLAMVSACATDSGPTSEPEPEYVSLGDMRDLNRANLSRLTEGMTREQAAKVMGNIAAESNDGIVHNPFRTGFYEANNGVRYEILYYYTRPHRKFHSIRDRDLTPLVFKDGQLIGWGTAALHSIKDW